MPIPFIAVAIGMITSAAAGAAAAGTAAAATVAAGAAAAGTAVAGVATAAGTALAAGAGTATVAAAAAGTALAAGATSTGGLLIISGGVIVAGKVLHDDSIVEAKKRGTVRASKLYMPRIKEIENIMEEYRQYHFQTDIALKQRINELVAEIEVLVDKHDNYAKKLENMGVDIKKLGIKLLGGGTQRPIRKGTNQSSFPEYSRSSYPSYDDIDFNSVQMLSSSIRTGLGLGGGLGTMTAGSMSMFSFGLMPIAIIAGPILFASLSDYSKYEDEQFRKECEIWEGRFQQEIKKCNKMIEEGQKLIEKGRGKVIYLQNEIIRLTELITQLKFRISLYEGLVGE